MKFVNPVAVAALTTILAATAFASTTTKPAHKAKSTKVVIVCPVTGEKIDSIKDAAGHSSYKGKTYYFCCPSCKPMFDKNPAKYVK